MACQREACASANHLPTGINIKSRTNICPFSRSPPQKNHTHTQIKF